MTGDPHDLDRPDMPVYGLHAGVVLDRNDPEQLGRVRIRIPGFIDQGTGWALPLATVGGGERDRGFFAIPEEGAEVGVLFERGDVDCPYYLCGNWGKPSDGSDVPEAARDKGASETPNYRVFATDKFEMVFNDNEAGEFSVKHRTTEAEIKIDGTTGAITIKSLGNMSIESTAQIDITGLVVTINGVPAGSGQL